MGDTTPTTTPTTSTVPTTDATMNTNATMNVNDVSTLIAQQVQQHTATLVNRITELENRNGVLERAARDRQDGQHMGQQPRGNGLGGNSKAAKPSMYGGDMGSDVDAWIFQVLQYAHLTGIREEDRAKWAATYLSGKAATWWRGLVMQQPDTDIDAITWDQFASGLVSMFKQVNAKKIARDKLAVLRQTHSVAKYNYDIGQLFLEIGDIHDTEKLDRYIRGLKDKVRMEVELAEPTTLAQAMAKAQRVDGITYHSRMMQNVEHTSSNTYHSSTNDSTPMDLGMVHDHDSDAPESDTLNAIGNRNYRQSSRGMGNNSNRGGLRRFSRLQQLSQEDFRYCQQNGLCLRCKEPGHLARNCSKPVKPLNNRAH